MSVLSAPTQALLQAEDNARVEVIDLNCHIDDGSYKSLYMHQMVSNGSSKSKRSSSLAQDYSKSKSLRITEPTSAAMPEASFMTSYQVREGDKMKQQTMTVTSTANRNTHHLTWMQMMKMRAMMSRRRYGRLFRPN